MAVVAPSAAGAKVDFTAVVAKPIPASADCTTLFDVAAVTQAGQRTDFCVSLAQNGGSDRELGDLPGLGDDIRDLTISLPPGQSAVPTATPLCSRFTFLTTGCPAASQVGTLSLAVDVLGAGRIDERLLSGKVFNLQPQGTEGARLGLAVGVRIGQLGIDSVLNLETEARQRVADGGLDSVTVNLPRELAGIPIELRRFNLVLWGSKADHPSLRSSFASSPTSCTPAVTRVTARTYAGDASAGRTSFTPTGCDRLPFNPGAIFVSDPVADAPGELTAGLTMPFGEGPLVPAHVKRATVILPEGFELSPTVGSRPDLTGCTDEQFARTGNGPARCPAGSQIGSVSFRSPLLLGGELRGSVFLAMPRPGEPPVRFFVNAESGPQAEAIRVKIIATTQIDPATGRLTTVLDDLPPSPFTSFGFTFFGGATGSVSTPRSCGTYEAVTIVEPYSGQPSKTVKGTVAIDRNCRTPEPFEPTLEAGTEPSLAGAPTTLTTTFVRADGSGRLRSSRLDLPAGLAGRLTAATRCPLSAAAAVACPADSRIGGVVALAGSGPAPKPLSGDVYLTEGRPGALAGLSIVVDAQVGPLNLGRSVTEAEIRVRPDAGLTLVVPEIPQRVSGVSANIRRLQITLDRAGFYFNATSCAPKEITGTVTSDTGVTAAVRAPYQATGCDRLPFAPRLEATIGGGAAETRENGHPSLEIAVRQQPGEASVSRMEVVLPDGISVDSERLRSVCALADYERGACAPETVKGTATAVTPLLPEPLTGPVTFVRIPGVPLPGLRISLRGAINLELTGTVKFGAGNRVVNVIDPIPDTPLSRFELRLTTGPQNPLIATRDLCTKPNVVDAVAVSHAGSRATARTRARVPNCRPAATLRLGSLRSGRPTMDLRIAGRVTRVTTARLVLPRGLEFSRSSLVRKRLRLSAAGLRRGARARVTVTTRSIRITVPRGTSASTLRVRLARDGLRASPRLRRQGRPRLAFRLSTSTTDNGASRATLRVRPATR